MAKKEKGYKSALENLIEDKGLDSAIVIEALTEALAKSYKKNYCGTESIVDCRIDGDGQIRIFITHHVVDDVNDEDYEYYVCDINLDEDEMARFMSYSDWDCPYFQMDDEYKIVRKQM